MPRLSTTDFWNRFVEYIRAVHDIVEKRLTERGEALSHLSSRASALLGRLIARGAERALRACVDPMLRDINLREVIETLFEEMGYFIDVTQAPSAPFEGGLPVATPSIGIRTTERHGTTQVGFNY